MGLAKNRALSAEFLPASSRRRSGACRPEGRRFHWLFRLSSPSRHQSAGDAPVDLNYLFHRQQVERSRAEGAPSEAARKAHEELARKYEEQIEALTASAFSVAPKE